MKYRPNSRFGEEPETMPDGSKFGRVSAVSTDSADNVLSGLAGTRDRLGERSVSAPKR
jgi:hypothetical protein